MDELFREKLKFFIGGALAFGVPSGIALYSFPFLAGNTIQVVLEFTARFFGTIIIAFSTGLMTVIAHDFYKEKLKDKLFKSKKKDDERKKDAA